MTARLALRLAAASLLVGAATASARAQTVSSSTGTPYTASSLTTSMTTGSSMGGLLVTAGFADGSSGSATWGDLGGLTWGVSTPDFSLTFPAIGTTFDDYWHLQSHRKVGLSWLILSGAPGRTVFDIWASPVGTPVSENGRAMEIEGGDTHSTRALYTNIVRIGAAPAVGDIFERLEIVFGTPVLEGEALAFRTDTDNIGTNATFTPTPEPATFALMAFGAVLIAGVETRRRRAA